MEIELASEDEEIVIPEGIRVIREVTDDPSYKNAALAKI
jgi:CYTH domain-containing protein